MTFFSEITPITMVALDSGLLLARAAEHLLGAVIGAFSILLGYRLFLHVPKQTNSAGKIVLPGGINIWLSRVGPGIFFSLFGTALVALSLQQRLEIESSKRAESIEPIGNLNAVVPTVTEATIGGQKNSNHSRNSSGEHQKPSSVKSRKTEPSSKEPHGTVKTTEITEEKVSYAAPGFTNDSRSKLLKRRTEARLAIADLNDVPHLLGDNTPGSKRNDLESALSESKLAIVQSVWGDWGDFAAFRNWVKNGATDPIPQKVLPDAVKLFRASADER